MKKTYYFPDNEYCDAFLGPATTFALTNLNSGGWPLAGKWSTMSYVSKSMKRVRRRSPSMEHMTGNESRD